MELRREVIRALLVRDELPSSFKVSGVIAICVVVSHLSRGDVVFTGLYSLPLMLCCRRGDRNCVAGTGDGGAETERGGYGYNGLVAWWHILRR